MSKYAIEIQGLGKKYKKHSEGNNSLVSSLLNPFSRKAEEFWALKDVNLNLEEGKVLGVVGPNGAGKSTFLKLLAQITFPSAGRFTAYGRVSSLLEVGTGFHPELSGRDNIYLNGSILGMRKAEIDAALDEIISFSGVEKFIHMPVKHYSSGMKVRLAFSVAAHLTAEILLIDEVLAVGDASFQRKCLERMEDVARHQGRTILFVSHNMRAIRELCNEAVYIDSGTITKMGEAEEITNFYSQSLESKALDVQLSERTDRDGNGDVRITRLRFIDEHGSEVTHLSSGDKVFLEVSYKGEKEPEGLNIRLSIGRDGDGFITALSNSLSGYSFEKLPKSGTLRCSLEKLPFMTGKYRINARLTTRNILNDDVKSALVFEVREGDFYKSGDLFTTSRTGVYIPQSWSVLSE